MSQAKENNADILLLPECFITGYDLTITNDFAFAENDLEPQTLNGIWGLALITLLIPIMAIIDIFLFKKRILQARLKIFTVMLCLGYYGVLAIYIWFAKMNLETIWYIKPWASIPAVCLVLTIMATRRILKDEALVRAADRIR